MEKSRLKGRARLFSHIGIVLLLTLALVITTVPTQSAQPSQGDALTPLLRSLAERSGTALADESHVLERLRSTLLIKEDGSPLVQVYLTELTLTVEQALIRAGLTILDTTPDYALVSGTIAPQDLDALAALPFVRSVQESYKPTTMGGAAALGGMSLAERVQMNRANNSPCTGSNVGAFTTEGVQQMRVDLARALGLADGAKLDGTGITVGIISDSYDINPFAGMTGPDDTRIVAAADIASGDLPGPGNPCGRTTPVQVLRELPDEMVELGAPRSDEARAMAQIVHDIAPGARLIVASGYGLKPMGLDMADVIRDLRAAGADIIVDDLGFADQSFFQDDPVAVAVDEVVADGAIYFSAAANFNRQVNVGTPEEPNLKDITSYMALNYRPTDCPALTWQGEPFQLAGDCHNFNPNPGDDPDPTAGFLVNPLMPPFFAFPTRLQWAEPWFGVRTDFNFYWVSQSGEILPYASGQPMIGNQVNTGANGTNRPIEGDVWLENASGEQREFHLVIQRASGDATPAIWFMLQAPANALFGAEYYEPDNPLASPDIFGATTYAHRAARGTISVGAVPWNNHVVEAFSSRSGPLIHFGPIVGNTPAAALPFPEARQKPDLLASNRGANTFFGSKATGVWRFAGTSAAAPHAAGVAALVLHQARASGINLTPSDVAQVMRDTAQPVPGFSVRATGAGLLDAHAAALKLRPDAATPLVISAPTASNPADVGLPSSPQPMNLHVNVPILGLDPQNFRVHVGDKPATVLAANNFGQNYHLVVLPPTQAMTGSFDLSVSLYLTPNPEVNTAFRAGAVAYSDERSNLASRMNTTVNQRGFVPGQVMQIQAAIVDGKPMTEDGSVMTTTVTAVLSFTTMLPGSMQPANAQNTSLSVMLYDDGLHGDGAANDGIYGAIIPSQTTERITPGTATLTIVALMTGADGTTQRLSTVHTLPFGAMPISGVDVGAPVDTLEDLVEVTTPSITTQPESQSITAGQALTLTVVATDTVALSYQWYEGSSGDTSSPVGSDSPTFTTQLLTGSADYWVRVSNAVNHVDSETATITVVPEEEMPGTRIFLPLVAR